ncbi:MAG TPA: VCBS repeat-containing protein, partial [Thermoanaerobaculia bacterium]|nr:VCBS repeat-containing protein [Thermoanaerobaculia bacterium]
QRAAYPPAPGADAAAGAAAEEEPAPESAADEPQAPWDSPGAETPTGLEDREWHIDEEGKRFYVERMPKMQGWGDYLDRSKQMIKYYGVRLQYTYEDDDAFYLHVYELPPAPEPVSTEPTPEEVEAVEATYRFDTPTANRLRFEPFDRGLPKRGMWRNGFEIIDMNGDGHLDIVHSPPRRGNGLPVIFLGDGQGNWHPWQAKFPRSYDYGDVAVADFNGDGHLDIALAIHLRGVRVLVGDGRGGFTEWSEGTDYSVPGEGGATAEFSSRAIEAVDFNGNGLIDLLAVSEGPIPVETARDRLPPEELQGMIFVMPGPVVYFNQGDGTWLKHHQDTSVHEIFGDSFAVADLNGNGRPDFVTATYMMTRRDLLHYNRDGAGWEAVGVPEVRPLAYVHAVVAEDFDGDGRIDLALTYLSFEVATYRTGVDILYQRDDGWERRTLFSREGRESFYGISHGDLNGDGSLDLVAVDADGGLHVWLGDGEGFFVREEATGMGPPSERCRGYTVALADLDGDGRDEVVVNFADSPQAMWDPMRCPSEGGLSVWKAVPVPAADGRAGGGITAEGSRP